MSTYLSLSTKSCAPMPRSGLVMSTSLYNTASSRTSPHPTPMYALPIRRLKDVLEQLVPSANLESVHETSSTHLIRQFTLNISGSRQLLLSLSPSLSVRLLRHERAMLLSEAALVYYLSDKSTAAAMPSSVEGGATGRSLATLTPKMLRHSSSTREMGYPYTIFESVSGSSLSSQSIYLTLPERRHIDNQVAMLVRDLALITSPSGTFGAVLKVYGDPFTQSPALDTGDRASATWSEAFNALIEGILRDGEDMSVLLPYTLIRRQFTRLSWRLKAVTTPRLTLLDAGIETNVIIERRLEDGPLPPEESVKFTGLRNWSQGVFGDPLLSSCFEDPSDAFSAGWKAGCDESLIEDPGGAGTRMLLYRCYRAIVDIVTEYYRPRQESSRYELEARRKLTSVLADLDKVDLNGSETPKRARSNSIAGDEVAMIKRMKTENDYDV